MSNRPDQAEIAAVVREMIRHEDALTNQRMSWFLTIQGLLFAALGFGWDTDRSLVCYVLAPTGLLTCAFCWLTLVMGPRTVGQLNEWWETYRLKETSEAYEGPPVVGNLYKVQGIGEFMWPWNSLPVVLGVAWIAAGLLRWR